MSRSGLNTAAYDPDAVTRALAGVRGRSRALGRAVLVPAVVAAMGCWKGWSPVGRPPPARALTCRFNV
ncbi:hypothetical protein [Nonomuraea sp. B1E8]|uniref:hypothetical protein n=1 Tax=unclassified Nonomuraea TaxID=2593643 RepID=UPI00325CB5B0